MSNQFQHRLQNFEATPPNHTWEAIEEHLNNSESTLQKRLLAYEATPAIKVWDNIRASLSDETTINKTVSFTRSKWLRYAAAAAILGIVALSIFTFAIDQPQKGVAKQTTYQQQQTNAGIKENTSDPANTISTSPKNENASSETTIPETVNLSTNRTSNIKGSPATAKRYKVVTKEDGKLVRLSQKAFAVFDCAIKATANKSSLCKENIQNMQAKMATAVISPTADFVGLIDMIKTLEENK